MKKKPEISNGINYGIIELLNARGKVLKFNSLEIPAGQAVAVYNGGTIRFDALIPEEFKRDVGRPFDIRIFLRPHELLPIYTLTNFDIVVAKRPFGSSFLEFCGKREAREIADRKTADFSSIIPIANGQDLLRILQGYDEYCSALAAPKLFFP